MNRGFSLVELSIVLVILGLLTGGILAGQSLIRAAELRSVSTDFQKYQAAVYAFRDKYFALPGDMTNATAFWGTASACPNGAGTGTQTCNGNGNGRIENSAGTFHEPVRAWQHLANAGLVEGSYSGTHPAAAPYMAFGVNIPASKIGNAGFSFASYGAVYGFGGMEWDTQNWSMVIFFGGMQPDAPRNVILAPEEAWNIDIKLDDGQPDQGRIQGGRWQY